MTINRPINNANLPPLHQFGQQFYQWLRAHCIRDDPRQVILVRRDLELRRCFLMEGHLLQEEEQFVILHIPPAYQCHSDYLRALASLALMCYDNTQTHTFVFPNCVDMRSTISLIVYKFLVAHVLCMTYI